MRKSKKVKVKKGRIFNHRDGQKELDLFNSSHKVPPDCKCGHSWEDHHHGCMMNDIYVKYEDHSKGACRGIMAQECEATQVNGEWLVKDPLKRCYCGHYINKGEA